MKRPRLDVEAAPAWVVRWTETEYDPPGSRYIAISPDGTTYATCERRYATHFATKKRALAARREYVGDRRKHWPYRDIERAS